MPLSAATRKSGIDLVRIHSGSAATIATHRPAAALCAALPDLGELAESADHLRAALAAFGGARDFFQTSDAPHADYFAAIIARTEASLAKLP